MANLFINDLIRQLNDIDRGDLWLDENFEIKLSKTNDSNAFTRPFPDLHSPAELISHLTVWRRINVRRMQGETISMEVDDPENFKSNALLRPAGWAALKEDFYDSKQEVIRMLEGKDDGYLDTISTYNGKDFRYLLQGLVHHDLYHMGQLGIVLKYLH